MSLGRAEFWTAFFTGALAFFTGALFGATAYAVVFARDQIRATHEEAQVQHVLDLQRQYESEPLVTYRRRLAERRLKGDDELDDLYKVLDFFETIGRLVERDYLNQSDVWDNFGYPILVLHADASGVTGDERKRDPAIYEGFTSLADRMVTIEATHHGALAHPSIDDVRTYYREELTVGTGTPAPLRRYSSGSKKR